MSTQAPRYSKFLSSKLSLESKRNSKDSNVTFNLTSLPHVTSSSGKDYYVKLGYRGSTLEKEQYVGETESLRHIERAAPGLSPRVLSSGVVGEDESDEVEYTDEEKGKPYMISEYFSIRRHDSNSLQRLSNRLALELHAHKSENGKFGFHVPTFCGATRLENGWYETWEECYDALIAGLQKGLEGQGGNKALCTKIQKVREVVIPHLLRPLNIEPVLLHGDLWIGNTGVNASTGEPVIYDPSSYYGHNEADLAIARIFGGFGSSFFHNYHKHRPRSDPADQYELRIDLYELFHYLNHALLFGGGYASSASQKMDRLLRACS